MASEKNKKRLETLHQLKNEIVRLKTQIELYRDGHKGQLDLVNNSIAGFWTNRLFNSPVPHMIIWSNVDTLIQSALVAAQNGNLKKANSQFLRAQLQYKIAMKKYLFWKEGIEGAGKKMQFAIGGVAVMLILTAVAAYALTAAAGAASTVSAAEQTSIRVAATIARADAVLLRVSIISAAEEASLVAELEATIVELETMSIW